MEYRHLGKTGLKVSTLSLGSWVTFHNQTDVDLSYQCMVEAFDAGVNFFDNAEAYAAGKAETIMGQALKRAGWERSEYVVSTKLFWGGDGPNQKGLSRKHIVEGTNDSLERLDLDYVDLLFCHRPDFHTPLEETVRAMSHIIDQGKALYWGTSEWPADMIARAQGIAEREHLIAPVMEQPHYNMLHRERVEKEYARLYDSAHGLGTTVWSPLASGLLTGKYNDGIPEGTRVNLPGYEWLKKRFEGPEFEAKIEKVRRLGAIAQELDASLAQLALAWCAKNPRVSTVITGASSVAQVSENMKAIGVLEKLDDAVIERIEEVLDNRPDPEPDMR